MQVVYKGFCRGLWLLLLLFDSKVYKSVYFYMKYGHVIQLGR
jgi:hypothetical protein